MASYLPASDGWLPYWVLFVGVTALGNAVQAYTTMSYTERLYPGTATHSSTMKTKDANPSITAAPRSPATPLSSRTFGTYTMAVGIARIYASYHMDEPSWYQMQLLTNIIGLVHFGLEAFVYKTSPPSGPWLAPVAVALIGLGWSLAQYDFYVR